MSFQARTYEDIVRDLLTTLTGGTVRETAQVELTSEGEVSPIRLNRRPVRRVSSVQELRKNLDGSEQTIRFTPIDYELISSTGNGSAPDSLRFRQGAKKPQAGSTLTINYYPVSTDPVPVTDLNVGSVVRTIMEAFARELAMTELQLDAVYKSAFLESATGRSLDNVVTLIGIERLPAGHAVSTVQFTRNPSTPGRITVPPGTVVTDADGNRYKTLSELVLEPNETTREVQAGADGPGVSEAKAGTLNRLETLIAGIASVTNPKDARRLSSPESDDELRRRARGALHGVNFGTLSALKYGLLSIPGVNAITITEFPNGIAGEVKLDIAYGQDTPDVRAEVARRIGELRPAGIRVLQAEATRVEIRVSIQLTLAGTGAAEAEVSKIKTNIENKLGGYLAKIAPGGKARKAQMASLILEDSRVVDCSVALIVGAQPAAETYTLSSNEVIDVVKPFDFPLIETEELPAPLSRAVKISAFVPYDTVAGISKQQAEEALNLAFASFISTRSSSNIVTVDALAAALRDDTRYILNRAEIVLTVEVEETFLQLTDGLGKFSPQANDTITKGEVTFELHTAGI